MRRGRACLVHVWADFAQRSEDCIAPTFDGVIPIRLQCCVCVCSRSPSDRFAFAQLPSAGVVHGPPSPGFSSVEEYSSHEFDFSRAVVFPPRHGSVDAQIGSTVAGFLRRAMVFTDMGLICMCRLCVALVACDPIVSTNQAKPTGPHGTARYAFGCDRGMFGYERRVV
jgi:hypothetical protein